RTRRGGERPQGPGGRAPPAGGEGRARRGKGARPRPGGAAETPPPGGAPPPPPRRRHGAQRGAAAKPRPRLWEELHGPSQGAARRRARPRRAARGGAPPARRAAARRPGPSRAGADEPRRRCPRDRRVLPRARRGGGRLVRRAGVLIPLFSLRGDGWGLGEIPDLVPFAAWARAAGFGVAQILPVLEVSGGQSSPYAAQTAFALDPVYL